MNDRWTIRIVAAVLGVVTLAVAVGGLLLAWAGTPLPNNVENLGVASLAALAALLANTRSAP